jgi:hypothetical protein
MQIPPAMQSAMQGLQRYDWQMADAASQIARFSDSMDASKTPPDPGAPPHQALPPALPPTHSIDVVTEDLTGTMLKMMLAQRAYTAQLRILSVTDEMQKEVTGLGTHTSDDHSNG